MGIAKGLLGAAGVLVIGGAIVVGYGVVTTEDDIAGFQDRVASIATPVGAPTPAALTALPEPVQRFFDFVFVDGVPQARLVRLSAEGQFRRPQTEDFQLTTAEQVIAVSEPALMFSATTPVLPGVWARAYDFFAEGEMEMKAKILSALTVVDERESPALNVISLRRWLLESALFPQALLPGGPVRWEPVDAHSARAIVEADGLRAAMLAHFDERGAMTRMVAEEDGDLDTPYHGSGEHVSRDAYRPVRGVMIPHRFVISRRAAGVLYPFFDAELTGFSFE